MRSSLLGKSKTPPDGVDLLDECVEPVFEFAHERVSLFWFVAFLHAHCRCMADSSLLPDEAFDEGDRVELRKVGDLLAVMEEKGDDGLTDIKGLGLKGLADLKKGLRARGYILPGDEVAGEMATAA